MDKDQLGDMLNKIHIAQIEAMRIITLMKRFVNDLEVYKKKLIEHEPTENE